MKKKTARKLVLAKETVGTLTDAELLKAAGGVSGCTCNTAARNCISSRFSCGGEGSAGCVREAGER